MACMNDLYLYGFGFWGFEVWFSPGRFGCAGRFFVLAMLVVFDCFLDCFECWLSRF